MCHIFRLLDYSLIISSTLDEHLDGLDNVLTRLRECYLKLNPKNI